MKTSMFKTAALTLAVPGLFIAAPVAAAPAAHSAAYDNSAVWGDHKVEKKRKHYRSYERDGRYYNNYGAQQTYYGEPVYANTRVWQGNDGRYYCRRSNGTTGMLIGGVGGALLGREIVGGDRTLGAILGAAGGALLGRAVQKEMSGSRCR